MSVALGVGGMIGCIGSGHNTPDAGQNGSANGDSTASGDQSTDTEQQSTYSSAPLRQFPLETLQRTEISINDHVFNVYLAMSVAQHTEGLMYVSEDELADNEGMLFVFDDEDYRSFWMRNTIQSLDIAYIETDGAIINTDTMPPLTLQTFPSLAPARFVLEVKAGVFDKLGIAAGDQVQIPVELSQSTP
jgi:uncharacterized membrane protein (UPF0127 family)